MNLHKFLGATSRAVLTKVRNELGEDAVILSNRQTPDGIEITAMPGEAFTTVLSQPMAPPAAIRQNPERSAAAQPRRWEPPVASPAEAASAITSAQPAPQQATVPPETALAPVAPAAPVPVAAPAAAAAVTVSPPQAPALADGPETEHGLAQRLMEEVRSLRGMIEGQFNQLAWGESAKRRPARAVAARELLGARYSAALTRRLTAGIPEAFDAEQARDWMMTILARNIHCPPDADDIVTQGGIYALVGPTGVGKTTTAAKLAARCAVRFGAAKLALVTTDSYRIGAQDQLRIYAKILGVPVHTASDGEELRATLEALRGRHLVLIDTVGMGQCDPRVPEHAGWLAEAGVKRLLLLNATAQAETLEEVVAAYGETARREGSLAGCIITKIDEAARLGPALDVVIRRKLALRYISNGQRVPEDLHAPNVRYLVHKSLHARTGQDGAAVLALPEEEVAVAAGVHGALAHA